MEEQPKHPDVAAIFSRLLDALKLNAAQFAKKIGSTPQAVSNYMVGRNEPGRKMLAQIIAAYPHIDAAWLATGQGNPFPAGVHGERASVPARLTAVAEPQPSAYGANVELAIAHSRIADRDELIRTQTAEIARLNKELGKPFNGLDAAGPQPTPPKAPAIGFRLAVSHRVKQSGAARPL